MADNRKPRSNDSATANGLSRSADDQPIDDNRRQGDGRTRTGNAASSSSSGEVESSSRPAPASANATSPASVTTPPAGPSAAAREVWSKIGTDFVHDRSTSLHRAYAKLQLAIMQNCALLSPDYLSPKDIVSMSMDIEKFLKDNPEKTGEGESALDVVSAWLQKKPDDVVVTGPEHMVV